MPSHDGISTSLILKHATLNIKQIQNLEFKLFMIVQHPESTLL